MGHVAQPDVVAELPDGFKERENLDVAHRSADLRYYHVDGVTVAQPKDPVLDLVGDVGYDLYGVAQVVAPPLLVENREVDGAGW